MVSFVKYGDDALSNRISQAVAVGLWKDVEEFVDVSDLEAGESIEYDGFGIGASDWNISDKTLGVENSFTTTFIWEFSGGGQIENNGTDIHLDFRGAESGELIVYDLEEEDCVRGRSTISIIVKETLSWYIDQDEDGFGNPDGVPIEDCQNPSDDIIYVPNGDDCDDSDQILNPNLSWFPDHDHDGLGDPSGQIQQCESPIGELVYVLNDLDPNDDDTDSDDDNVLDSDEVNVYKTNPALADTDGDGLKDDVEIAFGSNPNKVDSDEDGCGDGDEILNDTDPLDPLSGAGSLWYEDADADGFGDENVTILSCTQPEGYVNNNEDCNDEDVNVYPGAPASPDGKDNDCDGQIDKSPQSIIFEAIDDFTIISELIILRASSSSGLPVTFTAEGPVIVSSNLMSVLAPGPVTLTASQKGNTSYLPAESISRTFCVNPVKPIVRQNGNELTSTSVSGNQWYKNGDIISGATEKSLVIGDDGIYSVQVSIDGCRSEISDEFDGIVTGLTGINVYGVKAYPNPTTSWISFKPANEYKEIKLQIMDLSGNSYFHGHVQRTPLYDFTYNTSSLVAGTYIYVITWQNQSVTGKFVKQ